MDLQTAKMWAEMGFIMESNGTMFTGTGGEYPQLIFWPNREPAEFTAEHESAQWEKL